MKSVRRFIFNEMLLEFLEYFLIETCVYEGALELLDYADAPIDLKFSPIYSQRYVSREFVWQNFYELNRANKDQFSHHINTNLNEQNFKISPYEHPQDIL